MGLNYGTNTEEYEPEAGTILPRLSSCKSEADTLAVIYEEFCKWFGTDTAGPKDRYDQVSHEVWELWINRAGLKPREQPVNQ